MNKTLLSFIIMLLFSVAVHSQSLSIIYEGQQLENGAAVEINGELSSDLFYEVVAHARVKNNTDRNVSVLVERITHDTITGSLNQFCWVQCFAPWVDVSPTPFEIPASDTTPGETFSGHYLPQGKLGVTKLEYVFFIETEPNDSVSFVVNFKVTPASIDTWKDNIKFGNAYPNPASSTVYFDYELPTTFDNAKVKIFNLLGQSLAEQKITQQSGKVQLPVEQLKEGVYFYSLLIDNQNIISKKLIIRR